MLYVDVHTHLTDSRFDQDRSMVVQRAVDAGFYAMIVNGLDPDSNRQILELAKTYPVIKPALGIYPVDAVHKQLPADFPWRGKEFDVMEELNFIRQNALAGNLTAIGECGLDGHWLNPETYSQQEKVFEELIAISIEADIPIIIHTRKLEERAAAILKNQKVKRVNFHCFGGRSKLAQKLAEEHGWYFSIPANAQVNESFKKMLTILPIEQILTETDAPYLAPVRGERNEPANVVHTVKIFAQLRQINETLAAEQILTNYFRLFEPSKLVTPARL